MLEAKDNKIEEIEKNLKNTSDADIKQAKLISSSMRDKKQEDER